MSRKPTITPLPPRASNAGWEDTFEIPTIEIPTTFCPVCHSKLELRKVVDPQTPTPLRKP